MADPLVSVLMTSYNRENYITDSIESLLASTYDNYELIILDDTSTDRTVEIARSYAANDERIKVFVNEKNLGQFANRNKVATLGKGRYLKFLDSDDLLYPTGLETLVRMMERFPEAGYGLCSLPQDDDRVYPFMLRPEEAYERHFIKKIPLFHKAPLSSMITRTAFDAVGGFSNPLTEGDYEMWLNLSTSHHVVLMPEGVAWYRIHENQEDSARRKDPFVQFRHFLVTLKYLSETCPLSPGLRERAVRETHEEMAKYMTRTIVKHSPGKAVQMYRAANYTFGRYLKYSVGAVGSKLSRNA
jgi:glycosyltransferase involved in cell wall biosynthesis